MSNGGFDGFDDVIESNMGLFGEDAASLAPALANHDRREIQPQSDGLHVKFAHAPCGMVREAIIEWADVVALAHNIPPKVAYATRINPAQPSIVERYPQFGENLGTWTQRGPGGPWALQGNRCNYHACPKRDIVVLLDPSEIDQAVRVGSSQRWIKDEQALKNWTRAAVQMHAQALR